MSKSLSKTSKNKKVSTAKVAAKIKLSEAEVIAWHECDGEKFDEELINMSDLYKEEIWAKCEDYD